MPRSLNRPYRPKLHTSCKPEVIEILDRTISPQRRTHCGRHTWCCGCGERIDPGDTVWLVHHGHAEPWRICYTCMTGYLVHSGRLTNVQALAICPFMDGPTAWFR